MTLTIEELKYGAEVGDLGIDAVRAVCAEALANREAQPVLYASEETLAYAKEGEKSLVTWSEPMGDAVIPLYTAPPAPAVPEGWKLVPVEPTAEMINAALASGALSIRSAYRLMLAAAPEGGNG